MSGRWVWGLQRGRGSARRSLSLLLSWKQEPVMPVSHCRETTAWGRNVRRCLLPSQTLDLSSSVLPPTLTGSGSPKFRAGVFFRSPTGRCCRRGLNLGPSARRAGALGARSGPILRKSSWAGEEAAAPLRGKMLLSWDLRRAAWLLSLCLLSQGRLRAAAAPLFLGEEARPGEAFPPAPHGPAAPEIQADSLPEGGPGAAGQKEPPGELFQDVDPKALAAVLLQALQLEPEQPHEGRKDREPSANEERVRSETESSEVAPERGPGWGTTQEGDEPQDQGGQAAAAAGQERHQLQEGESLQAMLEALQRYRPAAKREEPPQERRAVPSGDRDARKEVLKGLEEQEQRRAPSKRKAPPSEAWAGARKLRQQQHLEHQLLQRRYEELAESRRQAEEARRAAAEEERLADMASDLLLQYLLKDGEEEEEDGQGARQAASAREESEEEEAAAARRSGGQGSSLLFEDEEGNVAEDKRSNEAPEEEEEEEEEEEDIDPNTIDRLIELSSKLHLPADDVIDIINDVEKKKSSSSSSSPAAPPSKNKMLAPAPRDQPKKAPPPYATRRQDARPAPKAYSPRARAPYRYLPEEDEAAWNEVLRGDEYPTPKWHRAMPSSKLSNDISPRTFQPPAAHRSHYLPGPMVPRDEYDGDSQARDLHDEELENYIERVLLKHPNAFQ